MIAIDITITEKKRKQKNCIRGFPQDLAKF